ncbi:SAICAR synthase-like protein [Fomitiporia mediterranea MF3/22]|uniref:SAICAR synthase-like protein n=1 Tax=Fomitiporia mediterranea (strain MF3/22) TaxID=694068 RepID=UPI0004408B63|nr:SAICAR synthase-like protein [Fomitiporia mediterranea MF3/22]EJD06201.1 SAICAR synthase-like protein [Fomitiporia mediterranea MF3/22]
MSTTSSPAPSALPKPTVRKLSNATASAISAGESAFHALASQVGGHPGVLASEDNALIVKQSLHKERTFYELLAQESMELVYLQKFVPKFYGTLRLEGQVASVPAAAQQSAGGVAVDDGTGIVPVPESIVLQNVASEFTKPNIMDIKLGTVLYEEGATEEKKQRMLETARNTTSFETGIRLTGFQVFDYTKNESIITPKSYGKSIKTSDLPEGVRRFFPVSSLPADSNKPEGLGLPLNLLLPILRGILYDIRELRDGLAKTELRMVGGSLLIVYEADWEVDRSLLDVQAQERQGMSEAELANSAGFGAEGKKDEEDDGYDSDSDDSEEEERSPYVVKLIDFAHTHLTPGEGPDEGVLKGMDTTISLFEGRIKELETGA